MLGQVLMTLAWLGPTLDRVVKDAVPDLTVSTTATSLDECLVQ